MFFGRPCHIMKNNYCFVTFITNEKYLLGLDTMCKSLLLTKTKYPLFVVIPKNSTDGFENAVKNHSYGAGIVKMDRIECNCEISNPAYKHWGDTFFKLNVARLTQFEKVIMLDLDFLILKNIDSLFGFPHMSACASALVKFPQWKYLNSGLMVIEPSLKFFDLLVSNIENARAASKTGDIGDQDVFNYVFPDWFSHTELRIPEEYNEFYRAVYRLAKTLKHGWRDIKIIHYWGIVKPWHLTRKELFKQYLINARYGRLDVNRCLRMYRRMMRKKINLAFEMKVYD